MTVFTVVLKNTGSGWHWECNIKANGTITETTVLKKTDEIESQQIAANYILNIPTYKFDGIEGTLILVDAITLRTPFEWQYTFEFQSRHAGYGDRTEQMLAQVITSHIVVVTVIHGQVATAIMDTQWNMIEQRVNY